MTDTPRKINPERVDTDLQMLKTYACDDSLSAFMAALESLRDEPGEESLDNVAEEFNKLGIQQGTVLSYAQYVIVLLSAHSDVHSLDDAPDFED